MNIKTEEGFLERLKARMTTDKQDVPFRSGALRGKIEENEFYFYYSKDSERPFTTMIKGKVDGENIEYGFVKNFYSKIIMATGGFLWACLFVYLYISQPDLAYLSIIGIPFIVVPNFIYKKSDKKDLEEAMKKLAVKPKEVVAK